MADDLTSVSLRRQLLAIVAGAVIGFVPTAAVTMYQAHEQRSQFLLDKRLSALKDFSAAVSGDGELMATVTETSIMIARLERLGRRRTNEDWNRVDSLYKQTNDLLYKWTAAVNAQSITIQALFPPEADPPGCRPKGGFALTTANAISGKPVPGVSEQERIDFMKQNIEKYRLDLAETIDNTQETIRCHAAFLLTR